VVDKPFCVTSQLVYAEATIGFSAIASLATIATIWTSQSASLRHSESASLWTGESASLWHGESTGLWTGESASLRHGESAGLWTGESASLWTGESASLWLSSLLDVRNIASVALSPRRATSTRRTAIARGSA
jgi:hypothetical protein